MDKFKIMKNKNQILISLLLAVVTISFSLKSGYPVVRSSSGSEELANSADQQPSSDQNLDEKGLKRLQFLQNIRDQIRASQKDFSSVTSSISQTNKSLDKAEEEVLTYNEQLANLDEQVTATQGLIDNVTVQIAEKENLLAHLFEDIEIKKAAIDNQKEMLMDYLNVIYEQESSITNTIGNNEEINIAKLLLSDVPVGEQLQQIKYFDILEKNGHEIYDRLENLVKELEYEQQNLEEEKDKLASLYPELEIQRKNLNIQRQAKIDLIAQTQGQEKIYQQLIEDSKQQQAAIQDDIKVLRDNLNFIQKKIDELGPDFNPDDYRNILDQQATAVFDYINSTKNNTKGFSLSWPISPARGITAFFHDSSYLSTFGVQHQAIDIRTSHGTPIHAPADGIAYKVKDNGFGYSYLILAHESGYMTVYGHVSEFKVSPGEKVKEGQIVALTGGTPGTKGAGVMTTGAHLHFEVIRVGKHVDPLDYLSLTFLPIDSLPEKYKIRVTGEKAKVKRPEDEKILSDEELDKIIERNGDMVETFGNNTRTGSQETTAVSE